MMFGMFFEVSTEMYPFFDKCSEKVFTLYNEIKS